MMQKRSFKEFQYCARGYFLREADNATAWMAYAMSRILCRNTRAVEYAMVKELWRIKWLEKTK